MPDFIKDDAGFKTVTLSRKYTAFDKTFDTVRLREPTYKDMYVSGLGAPEELQPTPGGGYILLTNYEVISRYIDRLAVEPTSEHLDGLSATDGTRIAKAVSAFFREPKTESDVVIGSSLNSDSTVDASRE
jgi:hypothetical protein